jgi:hypothetical protein
MCAIIARLLRDLRDSVWPSQREQLAQVERSFSHIPVALLVALVVSRLRMPTGVFA